MSKYKLRTPKSFQKDYKKFSKLIDITDVDEVIKKLQNDEKLEEKYKDHPLKGNYKGCRDCHIKPDLVLVYKKEDDILILTCLRLNTHSELFK